MADNTDTKNPIKRGCYCDYGACDCVDGRKPYLFGEQDIKYPDEVQRDDLIRKLAALEAKLSRKSQDIKQLRSAKKQTVKSV